MKCHLLYSIRIICKSYSCILFLVTLYYLASPSISTNDVSRNSPNSFPAGTMINIPFLISGNPEPTFELVRLREVNGMLVVGGAPNVNVFSWEDEVLVIKAPVPAIGGWYRVVASNQFGDQEFDFNLTFIGM